MKKSLITVLIFLCISAAAVSARAQQDEAAKIINSLMPYIKEELKGTSSESKINAFYASDAFKKAKFQKDVLNVIDVKEPYSAMWDRIQNKVFLNKRAILEIISLDLKLPLKDFSGNKEYMRRMAVCVTPIYVHEIKHQMESAELRAMAIADVFTRKSEYLAHFEQYIFMSEKQLVKGKNYYSSCPATDNGLLRAGDMFEQNGIIRLVFEQYKNNPQLFAPFDKEHITALISSFMRRYNEQQDAAKLEAAREADFKKDLTKLGIIRPGEKVLITVNDYLTTGKYNWNRITIAELDDAFQDKNVLFNKYDSWYAKEMNSYKTAIIDIAKKKQLAKILSLNNTSVNNNLTHIPCGLFGLADC